MFGITKRKMNAFGRGAEEQMLTDMVDDEYDALNDETFGAEMPTEEWETDQTRGELEPGASGSSEPSLLDIAAAKLPINDDPLDFLEKSISHLVEDDDDITISRKRSNPTKPLSDIFTIGSPQNPFFQMDKASIWGDPSVKTAAYTLPGVIEKLRINGGTTMPSLLPSEPVLVKGAKTAEELEAELLGKPLPSASRPPSNLAGPNVKSCQELERELIESGRAENAAARQANAAGTAAVSAAMPNMPGANMLVNQPPPPHPMLLANPQLRAAFIARWLAANPGAVPPVWFRMAPPPMMRPPAPPGFRPTIIRPGPNMPPMVHNAAGVTQGFAHRGVGVMIQQGGTRRSSPSFPKRRLFDSPGRSGGPGQHDDNYEYGRRRDQNNRGDPFDGLMTRRERSWLIKIQSLQLHSENPYVDDYYWMMYRRRKIVGDGKTIVSKDHDHSDNLEHRVYVPPSFEGSLGKVQVLSANFPRQLLDLATAANGDNKQQSVEEESPRGSPAGGKTVQPVSGRRLKHTLIELEKSYSMILEASDLAIIMEKNSGEAREQAAAKIKSLIQAVVAMVSMENRIVGIMSVRKGRRLLHQLVPCCGKEQRLKIGESIVRNLVALSKKEPGKEILATTKLVFESKLTGLSGEQWSMLWEETTVDAVESTMKSKLGCSLILAVVYGSAMDNAALSEKASKIVERWTSLAYTAIAGGGIQDFSMDPAHAELCCSWLRGLSSAAIPTSVVDTIEAALKAGS